MGTFLNESTIQENFPLRKHCPEFTNKLEIKINKENRLSQGSTPLDRWKLLLLAARMELAYTVVLAALPSQK